MKKILKYLKGKKRKITGVIIILIPIIAASVDHPLIKAALDLLTVHLQNISSFIINF
jgi:hypothetical protein